MTEHGYLETLLHDCVKCKVEGTKSPKHLNFDECDASKIDVYIGIYNDRLRKITLSDDI